MPIDFYYMPPSAPCRAVRLAAKAVGVDLHLKKIDLFKGEQNSPEFIKINPQHTLPTINDNGFILWESRAIMGYLVQKYAKNDSLYPNESKARAIVDQRLYFDLGTLYNRFGEYYYPVLFLGGSFDEAKRLRIEEAFKFMDTFLEDSEFAAGKHLTIADLALLATVSNFEACEYDFSKYVNVNRWYSKAKATAPGYEEANGKPAQQFKQLFENATKAK